MTDRSTNLTSQNAGDRSDHCDMGLGMGKFWVESCGYLGFLLVSRNGLFPQTATVELGVIVQEKLT